MFIKSVVSALLGFGLLASLAASADDDRHRYRLPSLIPVPNGFQPEGVVRGRGHRAYVGSLVTGGIYEVNLVTGKGKLLLPGDGSMAVGLAYDKRRDHLFVAGGLDGKVRVYAAASGELVKEYQLTEPGSFINDGIVTRHGAYFTNSFLPEIYHIPFGKGGRLADASRVRTIPLSGDFVFVPGEFNANGIEASRNGKELYVVNMVAAELYEVSPRTGKARRIHIKDGDVSFADGLYLHDETLYVVQNMINQVTALELDDDDNTASVERIITDERFRIPTTATGFAGGLYVINARFDVAAPPFPGVPPADPDIEFNLVRVEMDD